MSGGAMRERFSDTGEALMAQLRRQRVSHNTLVRVEAYLGAIMREHTAALAALSSPETTPAGVLDEKRTWPSRDEFRRMTPAEVNRFLESIGVSTRVVDPAAPAGVLPAAGTTTDCPLEGFHEHWFRGPHRFHEWEPGT